MLHYSSEPGIHCFVPSPRVELPHEEQLGQGQLAGGHGLLGVHWHLPRVDCDAGFTLKRPERRGQIRDRVPLVVGRNNPGPRSLAQLVACPGSEVRCACFRNPRPRAMPSSLGDFWTGTTESLLPHPLYSPPTDLHPTSPHGTPEKLATVCTCQQLYACILLPWAPVSAIFVVPKSSF